MMKREVICNGKRFVLFINKNDLACSVQRVAQKLNQQYATRAEQGRIPIFISILNGAFMYTSDLLKHITFQCEIQFVKQSSYENLDFTGIVTEVLGLTSEIEGRDVIVLDDIIDTGVSMKYFLEELKKKNPASIAVSVLIYKPNTCRKDVTADFPCIVMNDNNFIIGYGLDYNQIGRQLPEIYILEE